MKWVIIRKKIKYKNPYNNIERSNARYKFDLIYSNNDLVYAHGVQMILSIIDIFSRKAMIYKANEKKIWIFIIYYLGKDFLASPTRPLTGRVPKQLGTFPDASPTFILLIVKNYNFNIYIMKLLLIYGLILYYKYWN